MTTQPERLTAEEAEHRIAELEHLLFNLSEIAWDPAVWERIEQVKFEIEEIEHNIIIDEAEATEIADDAAFAEWQATKDEDEPPCPHCRGTGIIDTGYARGFTCSCRE